ncbi:Molybdate-anion transporter [Dillenia turbinata]|uniref:Molybdate-anion transporter n=1 Tax=Dillenia turbinata TaxID=194707 RepID=A0AAN8ZCM9_9MAGN
MCIHVQGSEEGMRCLLHNLYTELHHQTFSSIQSIDGGKDTGWKLLLLYYFQLSSRGSLLSTIRDYLWGLSTPISCLNFVQRGFEQQWLSLTFSKAIFLENGLITILSGLLGNLLVDTLGFGPVSEFDAAACFLAIGMAIIMSSWSENYGDPSEKKDLLTQFRTAAVAIASGEKIALLRAIQTLFEGSMYTFVFLWTPALSPNNEDIPHGIIFAAFMLSSMLGSSTASRLLARSTLKVESYMQIVFLISAGSLLLPVITSFLVAPSHVKGGSISFSGQIQPMGFFTFEACVGIFWPSIMKMRSQYIPEEARSRIMNFFRIPLNIFVCIVLCNVDAFPMTVMLACAPFSFSLLPYCRSGSWELQSSQSPSHKIGQL